MVASVSASGDYNENAVITAVEGGTTLIEAKAGEITASCMVTVKVPAEAISISESSLKLKEGQGYELYAELTPSESTDSVRWSSSDSNIVSVDAYGYVYAEAPGNAVITAEAESGVKAECTVEVTERVVYAKSIEELQSAHSYDAYMNDTWYYTLDGAETLKLTFSELTCFESGYDNLYIYDKADQLIGEYTGNELAGVSVLVTGDTVKLVMITDGSVSYYGFAVTDIQNVHNYSASWTVDREATCTKEGSKSRHCTVCNGKTDVTSIPKIAHSYGAYKVTKAPTALAAGVQTRSCKACGFKHTAPVPKLQATMKLNASSLTLKYKQKTTALKVSGLAAGDSVASYKSSNTKIFTVSKSGKITAKKKAGTAKLTIKLKSGYSKTITVKVQKADVKTTKITGVVKKLTLKKGKTRTLVPVLTPITSTQKITFTTSNKKVATVSSKGVITARKKGTAKITVKSGSKKVTCTVKVKN